MIHSFTRMTSIVLAFGFFFGCTTLKNNSTQQSPASFDELSAAQIKQRISSIDEQIDAQPKNRDLYLQKGTLLTKWAQQKSRPSKRTALYYKADKALSQAELLSQSKDGVSTKNGIDQLRKVSWSSEHNQGVQLWQDTSTQAEKRRAAIHFENATAIMPDSSTSYLMASRAFYDVGEFSKAIGELERARANISSVPLPLLEALAFLYLDTDQPRQAVPVFKEALSANRPNYNLMHGLSNAYMKANEHSEAVMLLRRLTIKKPSNATYRRSLASQLYLLAQNKTKAALKAPNSINSEFTALDSLLHEANDTFDYLLDKWEKNGDINTEAARYYQNAAGLYQKLLPHLNRSQKEKASNAIDQNLTAALPLMEVLASESDDKRWWQSLYQAYSILGMQQKAKKAKSNL